MQPPQQPWHDRTSFCCPVPQSTLHEPDLTHDVHASRAPALQLALPYSRPSSQAPIQTLQSRYRCLIPVPHDTLQEAHEVHDFQLAGK